MKNEFKAAIITALYKDAKNGGKGLKDGDIFRLLQIGKRQYDEVRRSLSFMRRDEIVTLTKGAFRLKNFSAYFTGEVTKVNRTCGFVSNETTGEECFVRGRDLLGSLPGDRIIGKVYAKKREGENSDTAVVLSVTRETSDGFTGVIVSDERGVLYVLPDSFVTTPLRIMRWNGNKIRGGDKVRFRIHERGERHSEHTADIVSIYGDSDKARINVLAYFDDHGISTEFSQEVLDDAKRISNKSVNPAEIQKRLDLRELPIFTIDGADTKDIDDAISISRTKTGYKLGVHIADVSHYVKAGKPLDNEAFERGTSVYVADMVIPMLPKELSNGICSLNPNEDRLAFSCLMNIERSGKIKSFAFRKTVIRSRVKGVYSEINTILDGTSTPETGKKYAEVSQTLPAMLELAQILQNNRKERGAPEINTRESKIICDPDGVCVDIKVRGRGISEEIIEEFMLAANNCAAKLAMTEDFPFVYRVHESPTAEKFAALSEMLTALGFDNLGINENSDAKSLSDILRRTCEDPRLAVINNLVLRTMMKAKYSEVPIGHFGLVMKEYAHFTSPIRRYADLSIHRILSDYVATGDKEKLKKKFTRFSVKASARASETELVAINAERDCDKFYMAEFMKSKVGEKFNGVISGVSANGIFVQLENTVEGRIGVDLLPDGEYEVEHSVTLAEKLSGKRYTVGDPIEIICAKVTVGNGNIDFAPAE